MGLAGPKIPTQHVSGSQFLDCEWRRPSSFTRLAALTPTSQTTDIEAYRCGKPLCHRKRYCPQTCKRFLVCQHLHYTVGGRWRCSVHHLGPCPGSKLWKGAGKKRIFGPCRQNHREHDHNPNPSFKHTSTQWWFLGQHQFSHSWSFKGLKLQFSLSHLGQ